MSRAPFARTYGPWAIIAGGSEGLGAAFAGEIAQRGVNLVLVARRPEPLGLTAARLRREHGGEVITVAADLAAPGTLDQIIAVASDLEIGLVVANAAIAPQGRFLDTAPAELAATVDLNCRASLLLARAFLPGLARRGHGGMIFVSSLAGMQGVPGLAAYSATKAYLISLGESLWAELRPAGVDVLTVCAGAVATPGYQQAARRQAPGTTSAGLVAATALRSLGHGFRVVPGRVNRVSAFALQRLTPRRAAITVFGRAAAASLKQESV
jgi:short-subunit dehydrogenase